MKVAISQRIHLQEGKSASKHPHGSSNASPDPCGQEPWVSLPLWKSAGVVAAGTFLEHVCSAVGCPRRNSRRPDLGWCRRAIGERKKLAVSFGSYSSPRLLNVAQESRLSPSGVFCWNPSWHVGSWIRQHTDWCVGTSGWSYVWVANVEICRRKWSYILRRLRTTTQSLVVLETDRPARGQTWQGRPSCSGLTQLVRRGGSLACL